MVSDLRALPSLSLGKKHLVLKGHVWSDVGFSHGRGSRQAADSRSHLSSQPASTATSPGDRHRLELCTHPSGSDEAETAEAGSAESEKRQETITELAVVLERGCGHQPRRGRVPLVAISQCRALAEGLSRSQRGRELGWGSRCSAPLPESPGKPPAKDGTGHGLGLYCGPY